jgi:hypothetical protein
MLDLKAELLLHPRAKQEIPMIAVLTAYQTKHILIY